MKPITPKALLKDLRDLITQARQDVARQVNSALVLLYWRMGKRIRQDILKEKRADYGEQIVATLSKQLAEDCCYTVATIGMEPFQRNYYPNKA